MKEISGEQYNPKKFKQEDPFSDSFNKYADDQEDKLARIKHVKPYPGQGEAAKRRKVDFARRKQKAIEGRLQREVLAQNEKEKNSKKVLDKKMEKLEAGIDQTRSKNKLWKNLVETYLAGGEKDLEKELFDPRREGKILTREILEKDLALQKQLSVMFVADNAKRTLQDFLIAMPTEDEYVAHAMRQVHGAAEEKHESRADLPDRGVLAELDDIARNYKGSLYQEPVSGEIRNNDNFNSSLKIQEEDEVDQNYVPVVKKGVKNIEEYYDSVDMKKKNARMMKLAKDKKEFLAEFDTERVHVEKNEEMHLAEQAQDEYVQAYRDYDPKATRGKADDLIATFKPPFLALSGAARRLKKLFAVMVERNGIASMSVGEGQIAKNLTVSDLAKPTFGISPELRVSAEESNARDERTVGAKQQRINDQVDKALDVPKTKLVSVDTFLAREPKLGETAAYLKRVKEQSGMNPNFSSPLTRELKNKNLKDSLAYIQEKRVEDTQKRLVEIEAYFADKNPDIKTKTTRQYLLGADIKGWFKGDQKQLQREYKNLYNSPAYQEWLNN